ncbi:MAG: glycosyltransferase [Anaerolineales bacterium]
MQNLKQKFLVSPHPHILMITNHGIHQWKVIPGLPDTGGQNVFVNQFTDTLAHRGYKITIINRGGYRHPLSGEMRSGIHYKDENRRILNLDDGFEKFVRKEDMEERIPYLCEILATHLEQEGLGVDLIISHYWDGAKLGVCFNRSQRELSDHVWVPHSLGAIKKRNVHPDQWTKLRIDERIANEKRILKTVHTVAATSAIIKQSLREDYHYDGKLLFLPPCVDPLRYHPRTIPSDDPIWTFLSQYCDFSPEEIQNRPIITEISRTDRTKRKDVLIRAFAQILKKHSRALLVISIDKTGKDHAKDLMQLIQSLGIEKNVLVLGSVWEQLPSIYAITSIYCSPSVMEGFGMSVQEAAATAVPVVASNLVPFVSEYLLGESRKEIRYGGGIYPLQFGQGAIMVHADDIDGFVRALDALLSKPKLREQMGKNAYKITIPYFTWDKIVNEFLTEIGYATS